MELNDRIARSNEQAETEFEEGYNDCWRDVPYRDDASESWQRGWSLRGGVDRMGKDWDFPSGLPPD